jgi:hypothetical protein
MNSLRSVIFEGRGIAVEEIRDESEITACGETVGHQLGVLEDTEDVAEDDDDFVGWVVCGAGEVGVNCGYFSIGSTWGLAVNK